jgi:glycine/D-amino acid oxidase-like deaminating enzyme
MARIVVAGSGIFGVTAAIELQRRGHAVRLLDPGPLPRQLAASTDISKVVRLEYGGDESYTALSEQSIEGWRRWNREFGVELYHETGLLLLRRTPLPPARSSRRASTWSPVADTNRRSSMPRRFARDSPPGTRTVIPTAHTIRKGDSSRAGGRLDAARAGLKSRTTSATPPRQD